MKKGLVFLFCALLTLFAAISLWRLDVASKSANSSHTPSGTSRHGSSEGARSALSTNADSFQPPSAIRSIRSENAAPVYGVVTGSIDVLFLHDHGFYLKSPDAYERRDMPLREAQTLFGFSDADLQEDEPASPSDAGIFVIDIPTRARLILEISNRYVRADLKARRLIYDDAARVNIVLARVWAPRKGASQKRPAPQEKRGSRGSDNMKRG
jgi:hypothetical protein